MDKKYNPAESFAHGTLTLHKYVSVKALEGFLNNGDLKLTYRTDANDPYEMLEKGKIPSLSPRDVDGFLSFTTKYDDLSMWGNYADKFRGACLTFSFPFFTYDNKMEASQLNNILAVQTKIMAENNISLYFLGFSFDERNKSVHLESCDIIVGCIYKKERYDSNEPIEMENIHGVHAHLLPHFCKEAVRIGSKSPDWAHEKEFRLLVPSFKIDRISFTPSHMRFTKSVTKYLSAITIAPFCHFTRDDVLFLVLKNSDIPQNVSIITSNFDPDGYGLIHA